jgi:hypothetical protein
LSVKEARPGRELEYDIGADVGFGATRYGETIYIAGRYCLEQLAWIIVREDLTGGPAAFGGAVLVTDVHSPTSPSIIRWGDRMLLASQGPERASVGPLPKRVTHG